MTNVSPNVDKEVDCRIIGEAAAGVLLMAGPKPSLPSSEKRSELRSKLSLSLCCLLLHLRPLLLLLLHPDDDAQRWAAEKVGDERPAMTTIKAASEFSLVCRCRLINTSSSL